MRFIELGLHTYFNLKRDRLIDTTKFVLAINPIQACLMTDSIETRPSQEMQ